MQIIISILATVFVFGVLILVHESGHFFVAKLFKVKVNEFSIGMGPAIFKKQGKATLYSVRALPFGGYVQMDGEDGEGTDDNSFNKKGRLQRFLILFAGAALNIILGFVIICIINFCTIELVPTNIIAKFADDSVSDTFGLQVKDEIIEINGYKILNQYDVATVFGTNGVKPVDITVLRDGKKIVLKNVKFPIAKSDDIGEFFTLDFGVYGREVTFFEVIKYSFDETVSVSKSIYTFLGSLFKGNADINQVSGPVGTSAMIGESVKYGIDSLFLIMAIISVNLGIVNLLPFPALDGGRILILALESIRRKPLNPKVEGAINAVGLIILLLFMAIISFKDILNLY